MGCETFLRGLLTLGIGHRTDDLVSNGDTMMMLESLPQLRFEITEAARILRLSRATLYERIRLGELKAQKDGRRRYITAIELQRYIQSKDK
jgi:excisionase family DNA binding protein